MTEETTAALDMGRGIFFLSSPSSAAESAAFYAWNDQYDWGDRIAFAAS
jgi:hypothetical protein